MTDTERERINAICEVAGISDIDDLSDGFHTFRQLYYQRMMLFAVIVKQNKDRAWKSLRHEDGELCFGGGWFIVGIDTPEGSYTYHYENKYFDLFDCEILDYGKHWDGHTEKDVTRLLSLQDIPDINVGRKDLIDRQQTIDAVKERYYKYGRFAKIEELIWCIEKLPSAQPEYIQNNAVHLCDSCQYTYATCPSHGNDAVFGDGKGNDNICACNKYRPISAQPEKETPKRVLWSGWKGMRDTRYKCPNCKKPVRNTDIYCHRCGQKLMFPNIDFTPYVEGQKQELIVRWDDEE